MVNDLVVLVFPRNHFLGKAYSGGVRWTLGQASALAEAGCCVYVVLPRKEDSGFKYEEEKLPNWNDKLMPVYCTMVADHRTGVEYYSEDIIKLLVARSAKVPFDIVMNHNTSMGIGMHKPLTQCGFSQIEIPVLNVINSAASYEYYEKMPVGEKLWHRYWEKLEALSCVADGAVVFNKFDYWLMQKQIKMLLAPSVARVALENFHFRWGAVQPIATKRLHFKPRANEEWKILLAGAFGQGREEYQAQAETTIGAIKLLFQSGRKVKLILCTNSPESDWSKKLLAGTESFVKLYRNPKPGEYHALFDSAHIGINTRTINDCISLSLTELMMNGKPTVWFRTKYMSPWCEEEAMPYFVDTLNDRNVANMLIKIIADYDRAATMAVAWASAVCDRHDTGRWGKDMKALLSKMVEDHNAKFDRLKFDKYEKVFKTKVRPGPFSVLYDELNARAGKSFGLYSRAWVLKMMRRAGKTFYPKNGELWVNER